MMVARMQKLLCLNIRQLGCRKFNPESKFLQQGINSTSFAAALEELLTLLPFNKSLQNKIIESDVEYKSNAFGFVGTKFIPTSKSNSSTTKVPAQANAIGLENRRDYKTFNELKPAAELNFSIKAYKDTKDKLKQSAYFEMAEHFPSLISGKMSVQSKQENAFLSTEAKLQASLELLEQINLDKDLAKIPPVVHTKEKLPKLGILNHKDNIEQINKESHGSVLKTTSEEIGNKDEVIIKEEKPERIYISNILRDNVVNERIEKRPSEVAPKLTHIYEIPAKIATIVESTKDYPIKAEIVLQPKWLGTVIVEINVIKENIEIMFKCENKEALQLIESNLVQLREKLQNLGFEKQYLSFQQQNEGGESYLYSKSDRQQKQEEGVLRRQFLHSFLRNQEYQNNVNINGLGGKC